MNKRILNHFRKKWDIYLGVAVICILIGIVLTRGYELWNIDWRIPMTYQGGDDFGTLTSAKMFSQQAWNMSCDRMGAPYGTEFYDFTSCMMHNFGNLWLKFFVVITPNIGVAVNITFLSIFFLAGIISFFVMKDMQISTWIATLTSTVFGVSPYMVVRGIGHIVLTECYFVPLSILLCFWIYERDDVLKFNRSFFKNVRNYFAILFIILIANNGIAYYPFFTCFLLIVTALTKLLKYKDWSAVKRSITAVAGICFFVLLSILPAFIYYMSEGRNLAAVERSGFGDSELYGLKIIQLFMPMSSHGSSFIQTQIDKYLTNSFWINENVSSYIGILGIIGFIVLMLCLFIKKDNKLKERLGFLSEMNIMLVLLGTTSGFGTIFAFLISDKLRAYNRISIFIEYVCILAFALILDDLYKRCTAKKSKGLIRHGVMGIGALICLVSLYEGFPEGYIPAYEENKANYESDEAFVKQIEAAVPEEASIFQLPYHAYPESGPENEMNDYHLYIGFIHSDKLKWSYGGIKGREGDSWNRDVAALKTDKMVEEVKNAGFSGIYIDRRAYEKNDLTTLENELRQLTGNAPLVSNNGNLSFFKF